MTTITAAPAHQIHQHGYDFAGSAWLCLTCQTSADDCDGMTEGDALDLVAHGFNLDAFRAWADTTGEAFAHVNRHDFEDAYAGEWDSFREFADEMAGEMIEAREHDADDLLSRYFDYAAFARDLAFDYTTEDARGGGVYVFRSL